MSSEPSRSPLPPVTSDEFRHACGRFTTGVAIASVSDAQGAAHGLTVSSFTSVSLHPPLILICLSHAVTMIEAFRHASFFGINILREEDSGLSQRFAARGHDRFNAVPWHTGETGVPLLNCALASLECEVHQRIASGDHDIVVGRVVRTHVEDGQPLVHFSGRYRTLSGE
jgi:flavin reductase (DIM6/NTAB) family NADH-FMN oxidoreductase RutF